MRLIEKNLATILFLLTVILVSCDDSSTGDNTGPQEMKNYFPLSVGNYWIYNTVIYDKFSKTISNSIDSVVITGKTQLYGKEASIFVKFSDGIPVDTSYHYKTNNEVFTILKDTIVNIPDLSSRWSLMFDFVNDSWLSFNEIIDDYNYELDDTNYTGRGNFIYKGNNNGTIFYNNREALNLKLTMDSRLVFFYKMQEDEYGRLDSIYYERILQRNTVYHLAENIGIVYESTEPFYSYIRTTTLRDREYYGKVSNLVRYNVNN